MTLPAAVYTSLVFIPRSLYICSVLSHFTRADTLIGPASGETRQTRYTMRAFGGGKNGIGLGHGPLALTLIFYSLSFSSLFPLFPYNNTIHAHVPPLEGEIHIRVKVDSGRLAGVGIHFRRCP